VITATLSPSAGGTRVRVVTNLTVSGKLAQFDRGEVAEASGKLAAEFARNLESTVLEAPGAATPEAATPERVVEAPAEAEIDAEVASYAAELEAEVVLDEIDAEVAATGPRPPRRPFPTWLVPTTRPVAVRPTYRLRSRRRSGNRC